MIDVLARNLSFRPSMPRMVRSADMVKTYV
jgi:hypothetical protein